MRKGSSRRTTAPPASTSGSGKDPRDREIERLRTLVADLTHRNEVLQEALWRLQGLGGGSAPPERSR